MTPIKSEITVFDAVTGAFACNGPASMELWEGQASIALPTDFDWAIYRWDDTARAMVVKLDAVRAAHWLRVRAARDAAQDGGCPTPLGRVDSDPDSRGKISGSVQMATIAESAGAPFQVVWTMQDNTPVAHDAGAMIQMGVAVGQHVAACHAEGLARRVAIDAAGDRASIEAVPVDGGWPGANA